MTIPVHRRQLTLCSGGQRAGMMEAKQMKLLYSRRRPCRRLTYPRTACGFTPPWRGGCKPCTAGSNAIPTSFTRYMQGFRHYNQSQGPSGGLPGWCPGTPCTDQNSQALPHSLLRGLGVPPEMKTVYCRRRLALHWEPNQLSPCNSRIKPAARQHSPRDHHQGRIRPHPKHCQQGGAGDGHTEVRGETF